MRSWRTSGWGSGGVKDGAFSASAAARLPLLIGNLMEEAQSLIFGLEYDSMYLTEEAIVFISIVA